MPYRHTNTNDLLNNYLKFSHSSQCSHKTKHRASRRRMIRRVRKSKKCGRLHTFKFCFLFFFRKKGKSAKLSSGDKPIRWCLFSLIGLFPMVLLADAFIRRWFCSPMVLFADGFVCRWFCLLIDLFADGLARWWISSLIVFFADDSPLH